jgi:spore maturation protein CgeB
VLVASSGDEMRDLVSHFVDHPDEREAFIARARNRILRQHTYFHRLEQILMEVGFLERAKEVRIHIDNAMTSGVWNASAVALV